MSEETAQLTLLSIDGPDLQRSKTEITFEYDCVMERLARLHQYANSTIQSNELSRISGQLFIEDFIRFSIHFRRLFTITKAIALAKNAYVPECLIRKSSGHYYSHPVIGNKSVWHIVNTVIHHDLLEVVASSTEAQILLERKAIWDADLWNPQFLLPIIFLKSDKNALWCFELRYFVEIALERAIDPLVQCLSESQIYLEREYRDL